MICKFTCPNRHVLQGLESQLGQQCICPQCGATFIVQTISPVAATAPIMPAAPIAPTAPAGPAVSLPFPAVPLATPTQRAMPQMPSAFPRPTPLRPFEPEIAAGQPEAEQAIPDFNAEWRSEGFSFDGRREDAVSSDGSDAADEAAGFATPAPSDDATDFLSSVSSGRGEGFDASALEEMADDAAGSDAGLDLPSGTDFADGPQLPGASAKKFYHIRCPKKHLLEVRGDALDTDMACPACGTRFHVRLDRTLEFRRKQEQEIERHDAKQGQIWLSVAIAAGTLIVLAILAIIIMGNSGH